MPDKKATALTRAPKPAENAKKTVEAKGGSRNGQTGKTSIARTAWERCERRRLYRKHLYCPDINYKLMFLKQIPILRVWTKFTNKNVNK